MLYTYYYSNRVKTEFLFAISIWSNSQCIQISWTVPISNVSAEIYQILWYLTKDPFHVRFKLPLVTRILKTIPLGKPSPHLNLWDPPSLQQTYQSTLSDNLQEPCKISISRSQISSFVSLLTSLRDQRSSITGCRSTPSSSQDSSPRHSSLTGKNPWQGY